MHRILTRQIASPAAGSDWKFTPAGEQPCRILAFTAKLADSSTAASRMPGLQYADENGLVFWTGDAGAGQTASNTATYSWSIGGSLVNRSALTGLERVSLALPNLWLLPGESISTLTQEIQAADQWSAIVVRYQTMDSWEHLELLARLQAVLVE